MIHKFCDGSKIKFKPKYRTESECFECGVVYKIKPILINKPDFHKGPFERDKCLACGKQSMEIALLATAKILERRYVEYITREFEKTNKFYELLEKK